MYRFKRARPYRGFAPQLRFPAFPPICPPIMQIPGHIDPVTTGTVPLRGGNRIDLVGLTLSLIHISEPTRPY